MDVSEPVTKPDESAAAPGPPEGDRVSFGRWMTIALLAGLVAGIASFAAGEFSYVYHKAPLSTFSIGMIRTTAAKTEDVNATVAKNAILTFAILGIALGATLGAAGGLIRRTPLRAVFAAVAGAVLGGLAGWLASVLFLPLFFRRLVPDPNDLTLPALIHGGIWSAIGAMSGLAFGFGTGSGRRMLNAASGAFLGAVIATILYEVIGVAAFPASQSTDPMANSWVVRLLARLLVSLFVAAGAAMGAWTSARTRAKTKLEF